MPRPVAVSSRAQPEPRSLPRAQGGHRDKRAKTSSFVLNPMDEALTRKCDQLVKSLMKRSQGVHFRAVVLH